MKRLEKTPVYFLILVCLLFPAACFAFDVKLECIARFRAGSDYIVPIKEIRLSPDKTKVAYALEYHGNLDLASSGFIKLENVAVDNIEENNLIPQYVKERLEEFVQYKYEPYQDVCGIIKYYIEKSIYSPDETKIAFLIMGDEGHVTIDCSLYVADYYGNDITRIDTVSNMCQDIIWLSENEILYVKAGTLWKATID